MDLIPTLEAKAKEFEDAAATIRETIRVLSGLSSTTNIQPVPIADNFTRTFKTPLRTVRPVTQNTHTDRLVSIIKAAGRFLHSNEVSLQAPDIKYISSSLHTAKNKHNKLVSIIIGTSKNNMVWGLPEWVDSTGAILEGHLPNMEYIRYK